MKVQSINSNYTNYNNQQNKKVSADKLSFGIVKLGSEAEKTISNCVAAGYSDINAVANLKKALGNIKCDLKGAFKQYQCSNKVHSKFETEAQKYLSKFENPEDIELVLDFRVDNEFCGDEKYTWKVASDIGSLPCDGKYGNYSGRRLQYLVKVPYLWDKDINVGNYDCYDSHFPVSKPRYMYRLDKNIIINEIGGMVDSGAPASSKGNKIYNAVYICHDVVAQLADLLNGFDAKCYGALLSAAENFNKHLFLKSHKKYAQ